MQVSNIFVFTGPDCLNPETELLISQQVRSLWNEREINFDTDHINFPKLSEDEQNFLKYVLSFSVISDELVFQNLETRFCEDANADFSARAFLAIQGYIELIHQRTYGLMLNIVGKDKELFRNPMNFPAIAAKINWVNKWMASSAPFEQRLFAFLVVEGIFFSVLFCSFYWAKNYNKGLPGMINANEFISRDEGMHCEHSRVWLNRLPTKLSQEKIYEIVDEAIQIECDFARAALKTPLNGINAELMCEYAKFVADRWITGVKTSSGTFCRALYGSADRAPPLPWMMAISIQSLTNFFEQTPTNYRSASATSTRLEDRKFSANVDDL